MRRERVGGRGGDEPLRLDKRARIHSARAGDTRILRVGLTGGIACGKSYVLRRLAAAGLATLDLDEVAHEVMAPGGAAHADVVREFGSGILAADGKVDRKRLGDVVFADPSARARLNALVHPRVREEEARRAAAADRGPGTVVVTDAALLVGAGGPLPP